MAKVLGEAGRYTSDEALRKHRLFSLAALLAVGLIGIVMGLNLASLLPFKKVTMTGGFVIESVLALAGVALGWIALNRMDKFERARASMRKGADGETRIGQILGGFPDSFRVINGLSTPSGDLDHVVVGPTGVFIVDSKNWRGVVSSDGHGELLLNGKPTEKATIKPIIARTMDARDKIRMLCGFEPPFFKVFLAFPTARVEARWGTTGAADCITDEQLHDQIVESKNPSKLDGRQVDSIAQAFLALATMDKDFKR